MASAMEGGVSLPLAKGLREELHGVGGAIQTFGEGNLIPEGRTERRHCSTEGTKSTPILLHEVSQALCNVGEDNISE